MDHTKRCHHCGHHGHDDDSVTATLKEAMATIHTHMTANAELAQRHKELGLRHARLKMAAQSAGVALPKEEGEVVDMREPHPFKS